MIQKFLNFIDTATDFGAKYIQSDELLRQFGAAHSLTEEQISALRHRLEAKGIL